MIFYPYFELIASLFILLLAFHIFTRHYANPLARFYGYFALVAFLAAILTYSLRIAFTFELAREINRLSATFWAFLFSLYAHFALLFGKNKLLEKKITYFLLYLPAGILAFLFLFTNLMYSRYEIWPLGIISQPAPLYSLFILHTAFFTGTGIILFFLYSAKAVQKTERNQALLIALGSLTAALVGISFDQLIPVLFKMRFTPPTAVFAIAFLNFIIYLAMRRYSLFAICPAFAASTIIETMPDSLLVADLEGRILLVNEKAHKFFHVPKEEIIGKKIQSLFAEKDKFPKLYEEVVVKKLEIERFAVNLLDPLGEHIPALINAQTLKDELGDLLGMVFIVRDIRG